MASTIFDCGLWDRSFFSRLPLCQLPYCHDLFNSTSFSTITGSQLFGISFKVIYVQCALILNE